MSQKHWLPYWKRDRKNKIHNTLSTKTPYPARFAASRTCAIIRITRCSCKTVTTFSWAVCAEHTPFAFYKQMFIYILVTLVIEFFLYLYRNSSNILTSKHTNGRIDFNSFALLWQLIDRKTICDKWVLTSFSIDVVNKLHHIQFNKITTKLFLIHFTKLHVAQNTDANMSWIALIRSDKFLNLIPFNC